MRCPVVESDARSLVELPFDAGEVSRAVHRQVGRLREVLTQQAVGVLVAAALPRARGVAEVDLRSCVGRDVEVLGHLSALVPGQRAPQRRRELTEGADEGGVHLDGVRCGQMQKLDVAGLPFHERPDRGAVVGADDEVSLPMAGDGTVIRLKAALMNRQHRLREPSSGSDLTSVTTTMITPGPQWGRCGLAQDPGRGAVDRLRDCLRRHPPRVRALQRA